MFTGQNHHVPHPLDQIDVRLLRTHTCTGQQCPVRSGAPHHPHLPAKEQRWKSPRTFSSPTGIFRAQSLYRDHHRYCGFARSNLAIRVFAQSASVVTFIVNSIMQSESAVCHQVDHSAIPGRPASRLDPLSSVSRPKNLWRGTRAILIMRSQDTFMQDIPHHDDRDDGQGLSTSP